MSVVDKYWTFNSHHLNSLPFASVEIKIKLANYRLMSNQIRLICECVDQRILSLARFSCSRSLISSATHAPFFFFLILEEFLRH